MPECRGRVQSTQLCWTCQNAVPDKIGHGCSWSRDLIPVKGWTVRGGGCTEFRTYHVVECPEYVADTVEEERPAEDEKPVPEPPHWDGKIYFADESDRLSWEMSRWGI